MAGGGAREELSRALARSKRALAAFEALPPSHQRRWLEFIADAKRPETRARRIQQCTAALKKPAGESGGSGYSATPLLQKLGVKEGHRVALIDLPKERPAGLAGLERVARVQQRLGADLDIILLFVTSRVALARRFGQAARSLKADGGLWVAWPKRASGVPTDLTEDVVREIALAAGLVDNKVCAIDAVWSGLRCVYRVKDRPGSHVRGLR
jgi:hypothetical protein